MKAKKWGSSWKCFELKVRLLIVQKMAYIALQTVKYQSNLTCIITVRVEMKLTKNGVVCTQKKEQGF